MERGEKPAILDGRICCHYSSGLFHTSVAPYGAGTAMEGTGLKKKDLKRFRDILLAKKKEILRNAQRTLNEDMTLDADDLPDEMDLASSEYLHSFTFRLAGSREGLPPEDRPRAREDKGRELRRVRAVRRADFAETPRGATRDDAVHPLQGRPGANRKGLRLASEEATATAAMHSSTSGPYPCSLLVGAAGGCAGPLAFDFVARRSGRTRTARSAIR